MINFVVAMPAEARPLIRHFGLRAERRAAFRIHASAEVRLLVTGMGRINAAAGTAYLGARSDTGEPWINVGVAGHATLSPGTALCAAKITDKETGRSWYPPPGVGWTASGLPVLTLERSAKEYPEHAAVDLEAAAFYATAIRFSPADLIQCFKVISDNRETGLDDVGPALAEHLISRCVPEIESLASRLTLLAAEIHSTDLQPMVEAFCTRWRFTVSQRSRLAELLRRLHALDGSAHLDPVAWNQRVGAREVLADMQEYLDSIAPRI